MARLRVVQRRELLDCSPADGVDHALAQPAVEVADELGVRLGQLAERAVEELDAGGVAGAVGFQRGLEPELGELALERAEAAARPGASPGVGAPDPAGRGRVAGVGTHPLGQRGEQPREQGVRRRVEARGPGAPALRK